jgi:hypothetical protein
MNIIYKLELNQRYELSDEITIRRVPGGWIYYISYNENYVSSVFVPFNNEFMPHEQLKPATPSKTI